MRRTCSPPRACGLVRRVGREPTIARRRRRYRPRARRRRRCRTGPADSCADAAQAPWQAVAQYPALQDSRAVRRRPPRRVPRLFRACAATDAVTAGASTVASWRRSPPRWCREGFVTHRPCCLRCRHQNECREEEHVRIVVTPGKVRQRPRRAATEASSVPIHNCIDLGGRRASRRPGTEPRDHRRGRRRPCARRTRR